MDDTNRKFENYHIVFWLCKDLCWALDYKTFAVIMIVPTITLAVHIAVKSVALRFEFFHNLAVCFWITANATWMVGEFFNFDKPAKKVAAVFFIMGLSFIAFSYLQKYYRQKHNVV